MNLSIEFIVIVLAGLGFVVWILSTGRISDADRDQASVARTELSPETIARVQAAYRGGRKIEAIKIFRTETKAGLKVAKLAVEDMMREDGL